MTPHPTKHIVFITGAFISHHCWDHWLTYFEGRGYTCIAPPWPYKAGTAKELRDRHPDTLLAGLRLKQLLEHYIEIVQALPEKPIVIGHSLGGLIVQLLGGRDLIASGIAIHSVPPQGVRSFEWSFLKSIWKPLGYFGSAGKTHLMNFSEWQFAIANGMSEEEQLSSYERYAVPESRRVLRDTISKVAKVDFKKHHPPLLFIAGTDDHIVPEALNYDNYSRYDNLDSVINYISFAGRNHLVPCLPTWKEEADYISEWLDVIHV